MKVAIISDTHIKKHFTKLEDLVNSRFKNVDLIIHAGDYTNPNTITYLKTVNKFIGVYGNNDNSTIRNDLKLKEIFKLEKYTVGIYHGHGDKGTTLDNVLNEFKNDKVDIIIFGHSHKPTILTKNNILLLNPGSATSKRKERWYSYIILEICENNISATINFYK